MNGTPLQSGLADTGYNRPVELLLKVRYGSPIKTKASQIASLKPVGVQRFSRQKPYKPRKEQHTMKRALHNCPVKAYVRPEKPQGADTHIILYSLR